MALEPWPKVFKGQEATFCIAIPRTDCRHRPEAFCPRRAKPTARNQAPGHFEATPARTSTAHDSDPTGLLRRAFGTKITAGHRSARHARHDSLRSLRKR